MPLALFMVLGTILVGLATPIQRRYRALLANASTDRIPARHAEERSQRYDALQKAIREIVHPSAAGPSHETQSEAGADDLH